MKAVGFLLLLALIGCEMEPGETVYIHAPITLDSTYSNLLITLKSDPIIDGGNGAGIVLIDAHNVTIKNLLLQGSERKSGNISNGLRIINCADVKIDSVEVEGFQKSGLSIEDSDHIWINKVYAHNNGFAGISTLRSHEVPSDCFSTMMQDPGRITCSGTM